MYVIVRIKNRGKTIVLTIMGILFLLVWAPWISDDYAINKVVEKLGGPETCFNYLGQDLAVRDIPKVVDHYRLFRYYPSLGFRICWHNHLSGLRDPLFPCGLATFFIQL